MKTKQKYVLYHNAVDDIISNRIVLPMSVKQMKGWSCKTNNIMSQLFVKVPNITAFAILE
jgi:hypothetical protein